MATDKWDAFDAAADRADDDMDFREVVIYGWTETWDPDRGEYETTLTEQGRVDAEVRESGPSVYQDAGGTDVEADVVITLPEDTPAMVVAAGTEHKASVLEDTRSGKQFDVLEVFYENTGMYRCRGVER